MKNMVKLAVGSFVILASVALSHHWMMIVSERQHLLENAIRQLREEHATPTEKHEKALAVPKPVSTEGVTNWVEVQQNVKDTVVQVFAQVFEFNWLEPYKAPEQGEGTGSGFFINEQGDFLTNFHVINQAVNVQVQIPSLGQERLDVEIVGVSPERDLALMRLTQASIERVKEVLGTVPYLHLGDSDQVRRGQDILALGYPLGQEHLKSTQGIISGVERVKILANQLCLQMTAPLNPGNSGGPSLNASGEVVGVNFAGIVQAQNVGYIIPINDLKNALKDLYQQKLLRKPTLGCIFEPTTNDMSRFLGNPDGGFYIVRVVKNSLAEKAGIQDGDTLAEINGYKLDCFGDTVVPWSEDKVSIIDLLNRCEVGDDIKLLLYRKGKRIEVSFKLEPRAVWPIRFMYPQYENIDYEVIGGMVIMEMALNHLPMLVDQGAPALLKYFSPENQYEPELVITHIIPTSPAFKVPRVSSIRVLSAGTLIEEINGIKVRTLKDLREALKKSKNTNFLTVMLQDKRLIVFSLDAITKEEDRLAATFFYKKSALIDELTGSTRK